MNQSSVAEPATLQAPPSAAGGPIAAGASGAVRFDAVTKCYDATVAVDALSLEIRGGEFFTLLGPSGSGKSTTLLLIAGFEQPTAGEIYLGTRPLSRVAAHKRQIGVVFQSYALFPHLTVFENVAFALRNLHWREDAIRAQVGAMLALVQLAGYELRLPGQLSGGQQQRVALARSLAFRPTVLLLDEPLGALDRKLREHMLIEFKRIHRTLGTTMIYVTHDQEEALVMSDRIGVMNRGKLVRVGSPHELYEDPRDPFVAEFIGETNLLSGTLLAPGRVGLDNDTAELIVTGDARPGARVRVNVRPERVMLSTAGGNVDGWNRVLGRVEEIVYVGEATKYRIRLESGHLMRAKQLNGRTTPAYDIGTNVALLWHVTDGRLLATAEPHLGE